MNHSVRSTLRRPPRRWIIAALALAAAMPAGTSVPALAGIPVGTITDLAASTPISGLAGTWRLSVFASNRGPGSGITVIGLRKRNAARTAWAEETWRAAGEPLSCGPKLGTCVLDDKDALGAFADLKVTFSATGPLRTSPIRCTDSDVVYGTRKHRPGILVGTVRLKTGSESIGVIRNGTGAHRVRASIPATASRSTYEAGVVCPATPTTCVPQARLEMEGYLIGAWRRLPTGGGSLFLSRELLTSDPDVMRSQSVSAGGPGSLLHLGTKQTLASASLDLSSAAPFLAGSVTYAGGGLTSGNLFGCDAKKTGGVISHDVILRMPGRNQAALVGDALGSLYRILP